MSFVKVGLIYIYMSTRFEESAKWEETEAVFPLRVLKLLVTVSKSAVRIWSLNSPKINIKPWISNKHVLCLLFAWLPVLMVGIRNVTTSQVSQNLTVFNVCDLIVSPCFRMEESSQNPSFELDYWSVWRSLREGNGEKVVCQVTQKWFPAIFTDEAYLACETHDPRRELDPGGAWAPCALRSLLKYWGCEFPGCLRVVFSRPV